MSRMRHLTALAILPGIAAFLAGVAAAAVENAASPDADGLRCTVHAAADFDGVELQAVASADRRTEGVYRFLIKKSGGGGRSMVSQNGDFTLDPGEEQVFGNARLGLEPRASYTARLSVLNEKGDILCTAEQSR